MKVKSLSRIQLLATPGAATYQAPPSMGFSRQSTGVGCHCLLRKYINIRVKFCAVVCKQEFKKKKHNGILYCYRTYLCISKFLSLAYWVFLKLQGLFLVSLSNGYSSLGYMGFSLQWLLLRWSTGSRAGRLSSCVALA